MINTSIECEVDADCPGTTFCIETLWFSETEDGSGCMCARLYGWKGEECEEQGAGTFAMYFAASTFFLLSTFYFLKSVQMVYSFLTEDFSTKTTAITKKVPTENTEDIEKQKVVEKKKKKFIKKNFFLLKAQILYLVIFLCFSLMLVTFSFLLTAANPEKIYLEGDFKILYAKKFRDWAIVFSFLFYFTCYSQLALTWLDIGKSASLSNEKYSRYFNFRFNMVRFFQVTFFIISFGMYLSAPNIFYGAFLGIPAYGILVYYLYRGRKILAGRLEETNSSKLLRQAALVKTCFKKLQFSAVGFVVGSMMLAATLFSAGFPLFLQQALYPKPGGINYYMLSSQIIRHGSVISLAKYVLDYCDQAARKTETSI
eukprot:snap_masked-scaffold_50-processed-gene-0.19-mRNA-1 protein AED:1.00 eAED:1.00 QI:0/0/0/0/1/1/2/0/369